MKHRFFRVFGLLLLLPASVLFAQDFSIPAIEAALEDELFELAEEQVWHSLSMDRPIEEKTELTLLLARSLIGQQRFEDAVILCNESGPLRQPDGFTYWKARAYFEAEEPEPALQTLEDFPMDSSYAPAALRLAGRACIKQDDPKAAESFFEQFENRFPDDANAAQNLLDLANINLERGHNNAAAKALGKLLERFPETVEADSARLQLARQLIADGDGREQAARLLEQLGSTETALTKLRIAAWVELAVLQKKTQETAAAAESLENAEALTAESVVRIRQKTARANLLMEEGQTEEAFALFDETIESATDEEIAAEVLVQKAEALLETEQYAAAEAAFQACLNFTEQIPLQNRALLGKGWSLWEQNRYEESAVAFELAAAQSTDPEDRVTAFVKAGDARLAVGQTKQANENYQASLEIDPAGRLAAHAAYQSSTALMESGALEEAVLQFNRTETDFPESEFAPLAALQQAGLLEQTGRMEDALQEYTRVAEQYTNTATRATALHQQGLLLFKFNRYAEALEVFDSLVATYPDAEQAAQASYMLGFCRYLQGDTAEALTLFSEYVKKYPDSPWTPSVLFLTGEHAYNRGDYAQAETVFLNLAEQFPQHELADNALFWTGSARLRQDRFLDAFSLYSRLAKEYPESEMLLQTRFAQGEALTELGEFPRAILAYEEIIKLTPDSPLAGRARGRLGDCLFMLGSTDPDRYQEALDAYQALYKRPGTPFELKLQALCKIARCEEKIGRGDQAFTRYMEAVYSISELDGPLSPEAALWFTRAAFEAAAIQEQQQNWKEAVRIYERAAEANVPAGNEAEKRIEQIRREHADEF